MRTSPKVHRLDPVGELVHQVHRRPVQGDVEVPASDPDQHLVEQVATLLGHADPATTARYAHLQPDAFGRTLSALDAGPDPD